MSDRHIVLVGSGALARSVGAALAARRSPLRVTVLARNRRAATELALACRVRAATDGTGTVFASAHLDTERRGEIPATLARLRPDVLVCCASEHSPYERLTRPSAWTDLVAEAGFGVSLSLQAGLVSALARALPDTCQDAVLVNGCFPDAVNPLLARLGLPVLCGIGNVATLAACLRAATGAGDRLAVLGHHAQLSEPAEPADDVLAWSGDVPVAGVTELLRPYRALPRRELNALGGHAAAELLVAIAEGTETRTNLPGPAGLPGGYPVRVAGRLVEPVPPAGLDLAGAIAWNVRAGSTDGVEVTDGGVRHSARIASVLGPHLPDYADGWPVDALDEVGHRLRALRERLRTTAPASPRPAPTSTEEHACSHRPPTPAPSRAT